MPRIILPLLLLLGLATCGGDGGGSTTTPSYGISGSVSHLDTGSVTINDGSETLTIAQGTTTFAFTKPLANGTAYTVAVTTQPSGENCVIGNASGTVSGAAVTNITLVCNTLVAQPLTLGVNASGSLASDSSRIFLPVSMVGTQSVAINAVLDSGSAGTVLNAITIFPSSMVSTTGGFVFPSGQTNISYNGITVTNVVASRIYGSQNTNPTTQTGNLGFAQVTFGSGTTATTAIMPILLVYQTLSGGSTTPVAPSNFANLIGINPGLEAITVAGSTGSGTPPPCTPQSTATCRVASPFRYFTYASGVDKGYTLNKVTFSPCDITKPGACPVSPALTIGVTGSSMTGFGTTALSNCGPVTLIGTTSEPICSQVISGVTVASGNASFTGPAIFDSGEPAIRLSVPAGMTFPMLATGSTVTITPAPGSSYLYMTGTGYLATTVVQASSPSDYTNSGIAFFAQNSLLVDYIASREGWRIGS